MIKVKQLLVFLENKRGRMHYDNKSIHSGENQLTHKYLRHYALDNPGDNHICTNTITRKNNKLTHGMNLSDTLSDTLE